MSYLARIEALTQAFSKRAETNQDLSQLAADFIYQLRAQIGLCKWPERDGQPQVSLLTKRMSRMILAAEQLALVLSDVRFKTVPAGRRSGKTELAKRKLVEDALNEIQWDDAWYIASAPTLQQAKRIFWRDLKSMVPVKFMDGKPIESGEPTIRLFNGAEITVMGMEVPERAEGRPLHGIVLDEYGNMRKDVWDAHIRPALTDRQGWAMFTGVPEGRNHYFETCQKAKLDVTGQWANFTWTTEQILHLYIGAEAAAAELAEARASMDELTYDQEYNASFVSFEGLAYYSFGEHNYAVGLPYDPEAELIICFDFNVAPGVAVIVQEPTKNRTNVIGEVYIPRNSNTPKVCRKIIEDWGKHKGLVLCFGDATGGAEGSAKVEGSDWALIKQYLRPSFGDRLRFRVDTKNPPERVRVNAVNSRCKSADGTVRLKVDKAKAPNLIKDFEGVKLLEGGGGEIDKSKNGPNEKLTHLTDALGYEIEKRHPVQTGYVSGRSERVI